ncbi:MAG TPA: UDP-N-acetylmuramoyl-L-alanine--D-glutamate ligase, partial [Candidatus Olsenella stercoravium]|nr:UDP-N-acetylmuramoyl-L-alanine--D-glutamate ligase [Candidatus Olsenella stercoravium]
MTVSSQGHLGDVAVLGLGRTGEAVARYLQSLVPDRVDSVTLFGGASSAPGEKTLELERAGVRVITGTEELTGSLDLAVASPGIPDTSAFFLSARSHADEVIGEPELAWRESPERWVAITGTNGKTTTTSLTTHLLRQGGLDAESVGNIGTTPTEALAARGGGTWFVAELSSFQLATTRLFHPRAAVLLNVTPDHLEWHHTMEAYAAAKERAFANLAPGELAVVSVDDAYCRAVAERAAARGARVCRLSVEGEPAGDDAAFLRGDVLVVRRGGVERELVAADELLIFGRHNAENALAAAAVALELGVGVQDVRDGLRSFSPIEHRIEPAGVVGGVRFVND